MSLPSPQRVYHPLSHDVLDPDVVKVLRRLRRHDHEAYLVGGCVRDLLLGVEPKDYDVATQARPAEIREIFRNSKVIGRRFRLAHVIFRGGKVVEVATFRRCPSATANGDEGDLLITDDNEFGSPAEDAQRRDFTINGMFYDVHSREIVDHVEGLADIETRTLRCIGDPDIRIQEDPVRILRAIRFAARLGLEIEERLWDAMVSHREEILRAATARVLEEVLKVLRAQSIERSVQLMEACGLLDVLLPEVQEFLDASRRAEEQGEELPSELRASTFWGLLGSLDARSAARGPLPDHALLAVLLRLPLARRLHKPSERSGNVGAVVEDLVVPLARRLHMARRDGEQLRQTLIGELRLSLRRRRGSRRDALGRRPCAEDAITLHELLTQAQRDPSEGPARPPRQTPRPSSAERSGAAEVAGDARSNADAEQRPRPRRRSRRRRSASGSRPEPR